MTTETPYGERIRDKALETNLALWNALLTANSILVAVGAILVVLSPHASRWLWTAFVLLCGLSMFLLVLNFRAARNLFEYIGRAIDGQVALESEEARRADISRTNRKRLWLKRREGLTLFLLFCELVLIVAAVWTYD